MVRKLYSDKTNRIDDICLTLGISRSTLYRYLETNTNDAYKPSRKCCCRMIRAWQPANGEMANDETANGEETST